MLIACWSPKGGTGTTVVTCGLALVAARTSSTLVADLAGDLPAALGVPEPSGPGLSEWMAAGVDVPEDALGRLEVEVVPGLKLLAAGTAPLADAPPGRAEALAEALRSAGGPRPVVVDCGRLSAAASLAVAAAADLSLLVVRPCYLALRRALAAPIRPSGVVLVTQPDRALQRSDIEDVLGVPVRMEVPHDPAIARAVDAGLLARRLPRALERSLRDAA